MQVTVIAIANSGMLQGLSDYGENRVRFAVSASNGT